MIRAKSAVTQSFPSESLTGMADRRGRPKGCGRERGRAISHADTPWYVAGAAKRYLYVAGALYRER